MPEDDAQEAGEAYISEALAVGMLTRKKRPALHALAPSNAIKKVSGLDIVKKASNRKGRCLMLFSCQIAPLPGGVLGELTRMDTQMPVLYMDFATGRLKFQGVIVYPRNKYMVLKLASAKHVQCEDVFEHMIVFAKATWVGSKEDNPTEAELPMPDSLQDKFDDAKYAFGAGLGVAPNGEPDRPNGGNTGGTAAAEAGHAREQPSRAAGQAKRGNEDEDEDESNAGSDLDEDDGSDGGLLGHQAPVRRSKSKQDTANKPAKGSLAALFTASGDRMPCNKGTKRKAGNLAAADATPQDTPAAKQQKQAAKPARKSRAASRSSIRAGVLDDSEGESKQEDAESEEEAAPAEDVDDDGADTVGRRTPRRGARKSYIDLLDDDEGGDGAAGGDPDDSAEGEEEDDYGSEDD